jgi:hypothetical protein
MFRLRYMAAAAALVLLAGCAVPVGGYYGGYGSGAYPYGSTYGASPYGAVPYGVPYGYSGEVAGAYPSGMVGPPTVINNHIPVPVDPGASAYPNGSYGTYGTYGSYGDNYYYGTRRHHHRHNGDNQTVDPTVPGTGTGTTVDNSTGTTDQTAGTSRTGRNRLTTSNNWTNTWGSRQASRGTTPGSVDGTASSTATGDQTTTTLGRGPFRGQNLTRQGTGWGNPLNSQTPQQSTGYPRKAYGPQTAGSLGSPFGSRPQGLNQQAVLQPRVPMGGQTAMYGNRGGAVTAAPRLGGAPAMRAGAPNAPRVQQQPRQAYQKGVQY